MQVLILEGLAADEAKAALASMLAERSGTKVSVQNSLGTGSGSSGFRSAGVGLKISVAWGAPLEAAQIKLPAQISAHLTIL